MVEVALIQLINEILIKIKHNFIVPMICLQPIILSIRIPVDILNTSLNDLLKSLVHWVIGEPCYHQFRTIVIWIIYRLSTVQPNRNKKWLWKGVNFFIRMVYFKFFRSPQSLRYMILLDLSVNKIETFCSEDIEVAQYEKSGRGE